MPDRLDPAFVLREIANLRAVCPEVFEDTDELFRLDMLEGETRLHEILNKAALKLIEINKAKEKNNAIINTLGHRQAGFDQQIASVRAWVQKLMEHANVTSVPVPAATFFIRTGTPSVKITHEPSLPPDCLRVITTTKPDMDAIKERLARGDVVPGAVMSNAAPTLAIRGIKGK